MRESQKEPADERFGANVRAERERAAMSQSALAAAMTKRGHAWHQQTVGRVERGQQSLRLAEAEDLAAILKTSVDRLTWTTKEASAGLLMDMTIGRASAAWEQIAAWTVRLLHSLGQLETSVAAAEQAGCYDSDRVKEIVREAHIVLAMTPEAALEAGRKDRERMVRDGEELEEDEWEEAGIAPESES